MKICIPTADWKDSGGLVAEHFGHTEWFVLFDTDTRETSLVANRVSRERPGGCRAVRQVGELGIDGLVCRKIGRKAAAALTTAGIPLYEAPGLTVAEVTRAVLAGNLVPLDVATTCEGGKGQGGAHPHHGGDERCSRSGGGHCH